MRHDAHLHTLTGAYALDALDGEERHAFTTHLTRCETCVEEVGAFTATAARLAAAAGLPPPASMRQTVLRHIDTVRQAPPRTGPVAPPRLSAVLTRKAGLLVIAAAIAAAAAFGGLAAWQQVQTERARGQARYSAQRAQELAAVLAAPDARTAHGRTGTGATTSVITSALRGRAVFVASGLPAAPAGTTYQLWFDDGGTMRPAGLLPRDGATVMQGAPADARAVGLTLEPAGGSPRPTAAPLLLLALPA